MIEYLFVYGTLKSGLTPPQLTGVMKSLKSVGSGVVYGTLYNLGKYPGLRLDGTDEIVGEVFEFDDASVLTALDTYEGYDSKKATESLFVRKQCRVRLKAKGEVLLCWIYEYNHRPRDSQRVSSWPPSGGPA